MASLKIPISETAEYILKRPNKINLKHKSKWAYYICKWKSINLNAHLLTFFSFSKLSMKTFIFGRLISYGHLSITNLMKFAWFRVESQSASTMNNGDGWNGIHCALRIYLEILTNSSRELWFQLILTKCSKYTRVRWGGGDIRKKIVSEKG